MDQARRGAWGGDARRGATAAAAVGPGGEEGGAPAEGPGGDRLGWGHFKRLYKAPTDYTKPQKIIQSPLYKAPKDYTKTPTY